MEWNTKKKVYAFIALVAVLIILIVANYPRDCGNDTSCFFKYSSKCSKAKLVAQIGDDHDEFNILGAKGDSCMMTVYLIKSDVDSAEIRKFIEGKGMICEVPNSEFQTRNIIEMQELLNYCTGPLKEAILQVNMDKLYNLVTKNLGPAAIQMYANASR